MPDVNRAVTPDVNKAPAPRGTRARREAKDQAKGYKDHRKGGTRGAKRDAAIGEQVKELESMTAAAADAADEAKDQFEAACDEIASLREMFNRRKDEEESKAVRRAHPVRASTTDQYYARRTTLSGMIQDIFRRAYEAVEQRIRRGPPGGAADLGGAATTTFRLAAHAWAKTPFPMLVSMTTHWLRRVWSDLAASRVLSTPAALFVRLKEAVGTFTTLYRFSIGQSVVPDRVVEAVRGFWRKVLHQVGGREAGDVLKQALSVLPSPPAVASIDWATKLKVLGVYGRLLGVFVFSAFGLGEFGEELMTKGSPATRAVIIMVESFIRLAGGADPGLTAALGALHVWWQNTGLWRATTMHMYWNRFVVPKLTLNVEVVEYELDEQDMELGEDLRTADMSGAQDLLAAHGANATIRWGRRQYLDLSRISRYLPYVFVCSDVTQERRSRVIPELLSQLASPKIIAHTATTDDVIRARVENAVRSGDRLNYDRYELAAHSPVIMTSETAIMHHKAVRDNARNELKLTTTSDSNARQALFGYGAFDVITPISAHNEFSVHVRQPITAIRDRRPMAVQIFATPDYAPPRPDVDDQGLMLRALAKRTATRTPWDTVPRDYTFYNAFLAWYPGWLRRTLRPLDCPSLYGAEAHALWLDGRDYPVCRKDQLREAYGATRTPPMRGNKTFLKKEDYPTYKEARLIISRDDDLLNLFGPFAVKFQNNMANQWPEIVKNVKPNERLSYFRDHCKRAGDTMYHGDASAAETAHVKRIVKDIVLTNYYHQLSTMASDQAFFRANIAPALYADLRLRAKCMVIRARSIKRSGEADTSCGHAALFVPVEHFIVAWNARRLGRPWDESTHFFICEGDDGAGSLPRDLIPTEAQYAQFNIKRVNNIARDESELGFCRLAADPVSGVQIRDPKTWLSHIAFVPVDNISKRNRPIWLLQKALSAVAEVPACPVIAPIAWSIIDRHSHLFPALEKFLSRTKFLNTYERGETRFAIDNLTFLRKTVPVSARIAVETQFGVCVDEQYRLERIVPNLGDEDVYSVAAEVPDAWVSYFRDHYGQRNAPRHKNTPTSGISSLRGKIRFPAELSLVSALECMVANQQVDQPGWRSGMASPEHATKHETRWGSSTKESFSTKQTTTPEEAAPEEGAVGGGESVPPCHQGPVWSGPGGAGAGRPIVPDLHGATALADRPHIRRSRQLRLLRRANRSRRQTDGNCNNQLPLGADHQRVEGDNGCDAIYGDSVVTVASVLSALGPDGRDARRERLHRPGVHRHDLDRLWNGSRLRAARRLRALRDRPKPDHHDLRRARVLSPERRPACADRHNNPLLPGSERGLALQGSQHCCSRNCRLRVGIIDSDKYDSQFGWRHGHWGSRDDAHLQCQLHRERRVRPRRWRVGRTWHRRRSAVLDAGRRQVYHGGDQRHHARHLLQLPGSRCRCCSDRSSFKLGRPWAWGGATGTLNKLPPQAARPALYGPGGPAGYTRLGPADGFRPVTVSVGPALPTYSTAEQKDRWAEAVIRTVTGLFGGQYKPLPEYPRKKEL